MNVGIRKGFTLVEALVALSLVTLVGGTAFAVFAGGLRIWERLNEQGAQEQEIQLVLEQMRRDLTNLRPFHPIGLKGAYDEVSFPSIVPVTFRDLESGENFEVQEIGRVAYFYDSYHRTLRRSETPYRLVRRYSVKEISRPVLGQVQKFRFSYYSTEPDGEGGGWAGNWEEENLPLALKMEMEYRDETTQKSKTQTLVVPLPIAQIQKP